MATNSLPHAQLLKSTLLAPGDMKLLATVRSSAPAILDELEQLSDDPFTEALQIINPEWVAAVYEALAGEHPVPQGELIDALFEAECTEDRDIGLAFDQALCISLPRSLTQWEGFNLVEVSEEQCVRVRQEPSVQASQQAVHLVPFGITPKIVLVATEAIAGLADRLSRRLHLDDGSPLWVVDSFQDETDPRRMSMKMLSNEVALSTELPKANAAAVTHWCYKAAQYKPRLFNGFYARCDVGQLELARRARVKNLFVRWASEFQATL